MQRFARTKTGLQLSTAKSGGADLSQITHIACLLDVVNRPADRRSSAKIAIPSEIEPSLAQFSSSREPLFHWGGKALIDLLIKLGQKP